MSSAAHPMFDLPYFIWSAIPASGCSWVETIENTDSRVVVRVKYLNRTRPVNFTIGFTRGEGFWFVSEADKMPKGLRETFDWRVRDEPRQVAEIKDRITPEV